MSTYTLVYLLIYINNLSFYLNIIKQANKITYVSNINNKNPKTVFSIKKSK